MRFLKEPESITAPVGDKVTFECEVNVPAEWLVWRWRADDNAKWTDVVKSSDIDIHTTNTYARLVVHIRENTHAAVYQVCKTGFNFLHKYSH